MRLARLLLLLSALLAIAPAGGIAQTGAEEQSTPVLLEQWDAEAALIEKILDESSPDSGEIEAMRATIEEQRRTIRKLIEPIEVESNPARQQLEALGEPPEDPKTEAPDVRAERERISTRLAAFDARIKLLNQADARAAALLDRLAQVRRDLFTRELITRGPSPLEPGVIRGAIAALGGVASQIVSETSGRISGSEMNVAFFVRVILLPVLIGAALFLLHGLKNAVLRRLRGAIASGGSLQRDVLAAVGITLVRLALPALAVTLAFFAVWNSELLGTQGNALLRGLAVAAMIVTGAYALSGAFYSPYSPELRLSTLPEDQAEAAHYWLMTLALIVGLDRVLVLRLDRMGGSIDLLTVMNTALLVAGAMAVWGFSRHLAGRSLPPAAEAPDSRAEPDEEPEPERETDLSRLFLVAARSVGLLIAVCAPALALAGYFAASRFVFYPVVFSGAIIGFCVLLFHAARETVDHVTEPRDKGSKSRIQLIPIAVGFLLSCAALPVLALVWGADMADLRAAWRSFSEGFHVGDVTIAPLDYVNFLIVFSIGYVVTRILQGVLGRSVLPLTGLDAGGAAAVRAGVGYVGITLSALIAISATGLDLSNLAIVAGALSVGIGFGLQNIVNNFISGIILLVERPIKAGDWVQLGSGMGYVKQVNVRSTEIETFDRASLIVPNSELISGPVTNVTHNSMNGRLIVPIGVAYGSDPRKVETILTEIAKAQPMLLRRPAPFVLFRRFGPDSLEFEIRGVLRDVNWILNVTSDINFEIARRFAEAGIEIPFAQRDLHLKNAGELGQSIGDALRGSKGDGADTAAPPKPAERKRRRRPPAAGGDLDADS